MGSTPSPATSLSSPRPPPPLPPPPRARGEPEEKLSLFLRTGDAWIYCFIIGHYLRNVYQKKNSISIYRSARFGIDSGWRQMAPLAAHEISWPI